MKQKGQRPEASFMLKNLFLFLIFPFFIYSQEKQLNKESYLKMDNQRIEDFSKRMEQFYTLNNESSIKEITPLVLESPDTSEASKESILAFHRKIFLFQYPSDGLMIKGFISFTPHSE